MIFLSDKNSPWITKLSASRTDYPPLQKAVKYFEDHKLGKRFNGGIEVPLKDLPEVFKHYYCITMCDATFHAGYFSDPAQSFIGCLHYSGDLQIAALNKKSEPGMVKALGETKFKRKLDSLTRPGSQRH